MGNQKRMAHIKLQHADQFIAAAALLGVVACVTINVFCRYVLGFIFNWMEELATIMFIWCTYLGIAAAYRSDDHVGINVLVNLLPEKPRFIIQLFVDVFIVILNLVIFLLSIRLCISSWTKTTPIVGMSYTFVNVSMTISFALLIFYGIQKIYSAIKRGPYEGAPENIM